MCGGGGGYTAVLVNKTVVVDSLFIVSGGFVFGPSVL